MPRFSAAVIDHFTNPRNCGRVENADVAAFVGNAVCGDQILLTARISNDVVGEIAFEAFGCSASLAVASILTERLTGMPVPDITRVDQARVADWSGGLAPDQQHVAVLGSDVAHRLIANYRSGISDDAGTVCGG